MSDKKAKKYRCVTMSELMETTDNTVSGSAKTVQAIENIDKEIKFVVERKGEIFFIIEA